MAEGYNFPINQKWGHQFIQKLGLISWPSAFTGKKSPVAQWWVSPLKSHLSRNLDRLSVKTCSRLAQTVLNRARTNSKEQIRPMKMVQLRKYKDQSMDFQKPRKSRAGMAAACNPGTKQRKTKLLPARRDALVSLVGRTPRPSGPASHCSKRPCL